MTMSGVILSTLPGRGVVRDVAEAVLAAIAARQQIAGILPGGLPAWQAKPFVQLGSLEYRLVGPVRGLEAQREHQYAERPVIEGVSRLQYTGRKPEELLLLLELHTDYCDPAAELTALRLAEERHEALPLVWASGEIRGRYVIGQVQETIERTDALGSPLYAVVRITLREWVEDQLVVVRQSPSVTAARPRRKAAPAVRSSGATRTWGDEGQLQANAARLSLPPAAARDATAVRPRPAPTGDHRAVPVPVILRQQGA